MLEALAAVPRDRFVPAASRRAAAEDRPLPIGDGQTTSQPSLVAAMLAALELDGSERVLEIGTGPGYEAALLAYLAAEVHSVERVEPLAARARENLVACGLGRVDVVAADGTIGLPEHAPYDAIVIAAAAAEPPAALAEQLVEGGRLVAPVGPPERQTVVLYEARGGALSTVRRLDAVRFVPLVPDQGGADVDDRPPRP